MDELKTPVKTGLVNLIFGIYENNAKEVCDALEDIEVLKKGADRVSVEKIARTFLSDFVDTVNNDKQWVSQLSKEEQREIRRRRRVQLGADLFSVGSDVPFRFPPTFTFVFRAFTSLDGIGKGLDPAYDLTKLAQPYLKELIDLKDGSAFVTALKTWGKRLGWRPVDISNVVQSPRKVAYLEDVVTKLEQGDLKLRVRVLESERSFQRMDAMQTTMAYAAGASTFLNVGLLMTLLGSLNGHPSWQASKSTVALISKISLLLAGIFGAQVPVRVLQLKALDKKFENFK